MQILLVPICKSGRQEIADKSSAYTGRSCFPAMRGSKTLSEPSPSPPSFSWRLRPPPFQILACVVGRRAGCVYVVWCCVVWRRGCQAPVARIDGRLCAKNSFCLKRAHICWWKSVSARASLACSCCSSFWAAAAYLVFGKNWTVPSTCA